MSDTQATLTRDEASVAQDRLAWSTALWCCAFLQDYEEDRRQD